MRHSMKTFNSLLRTGIRRTIVSLACLALFAGCSFAPKYAKPSVQTPVAFKEMTPAQSQETDGWKTAEPKDDVIRGQWWEMFHEPELNAFESQVNVSNQTVAVALANFLAGGREKGAGGGETIPVAIFPDRDRQSFGHEVTTGHISKSIQLVIVSLDFHRICAAL